MTVEKALTPYFARKEELSVLAGCVLWGSRVVIPRQGRKEVLDLQLEYHPGIVKMKNLARSYIWWPSMDTWLEEKVTESCQVCQSHQKTPLCSHCISGNGRAVLGLGYMSARHAPSWGKCSC